MIQPTLDDPIAAPQIDDSIVRDFGWTMLDERLRNNVTSLWPYLDKALTAYEVKNPSFGTFRATGSIYQMAVLIIRSMEGPLPRGDSNSADTQAALAVLKERPPGFNDFFGALRRRLVDKLVPDIAEDTIKHINLFIDFTSTNNE